MSRRSPLKKRPERGGSPISNTSDFNRKRIADLESEIRSKISKLEREERRYNEIEANYKILNREYEEVSAQLSELERKHRKKVKEYDRYRADVEEREEARHGTLIGRIIGGPFRFINSIFRKEIRVRDEKINNQRRNLTSLQDKQAELKHNLAEQKKHSESHRVSAKNWQRRFNELKKEIREERGLEKDPLILNLRETLERKDSKIENLEERLAIASSESQRPARTIETVTQALTIAEEDFDNITILDSGWKSAKKSNYRDPGQVYETLLVMSRESFLWQSEQEGDGPFEDRLRKYLDVADHDSKDRFWNTGEVSEKMNKHVKLGVDHNSRNTLRIYYDINRESGVRIAHCGEHP